MTFPAATGLSWDALHPRALCGLSDLTLAMIITILARAERIGNWPEAVQLVIIVLLPKSDGGFRPIGLILWHPIIWMSTKRCSHHVGEGARPTISICGSRQRRRCGGVETRCSCRARCKMQPCLWHRFAGPGQSVRKDSPCIPSQGGHPTRLPAMAA